MRRKRNTRMPGSRRLPTRRLADVLALLVMLGGAAPLTPQPGDPTRGRAIVENRALSACLLCHSGPFPAPHLQGTIGPPLDGIGSRLTVDEIRDRLIDARR